MKTPNADDNMAAKAADLPQISFAKRPMLREWLEINHASSSGVLVRIYKKSSKIESITFEDLLEEGLCFGWSESQRFKGSEEYYLQKFTPRKTRGTVSDRNKRLIAKLEASGQMTEAGRAKL